MAWTPVGPQEELEQARGLVKRFGAKQIALFQSADGRFYACNNRCPHQGYPLAAGTLDGGCILTCNWHKWKFDLATGNTLVGGDTLRVYPTRVNNGIVEVDLSDPPAGQRVEAARHNLQIANQALSFVAKEG